MTQMPSEPGVRTAADIDADALERKYREERDRRLRADGSDQYVEIELGSALEADPFVDAVRERDPVSETVEIVVLGGGYSGLLSAVELARVGVRDIRIVEKGADFGGTWYWNRYPGLSCDVESYIYLPYLEELGYMPTERYAKGAEILDYARTVAKRWDLYEHALFQTKATDVGWDEGSARWIVRTDRGDEIRGRFLVLGTGGLLHRPKLPGVPGVESFAGKAFHTSRWDYSYTGGGSDGGLSGLADKRVAVIGTGATALQVVPHVGADARQLYVFQRTPTAVDIRANQVTDQDWFRSLEPGWQERRIQNFDALLGGIPQDDDLVGDQWTEIWGLPDLDLPTDGSAPDLEGYMRRVRENDHVQMERIRARIDELVDDRATAEGLKPWFSTHCKRPGFHDGYLQTFNRPNVTLVDTRGRGPDRITADAVHFDGVAYEVDCIIYATGFESAVSPGRAGGFPVRGRRGMELESKWARDFRTLHGIQTGGFPNMFIVGGIRHAAVTINVLYANGVQARHVAGVISSLIDEGVRSMEISPEAETYWEEMLAANSVYEQSAADACTPGWYNNEGATSEGGNRLPLFAAAFGGGAMAYAELLEQWFSKHLGEHAVLAR